MRSYARKMKSCIHVTASLTYVYDVAAFEIMHEHHACLIAELRLYHVVHIVLYHEHIAHSPALYLKLAESHGNVLVPDIIGSNMGAEPAYLKGIPVHTVALHFFSLSAHRIVCGNKGNVRVIFEVLVVAYHKPAYEVVVSRPALAGRVTAGIHEYLQLFLIRKLSEHVKLIVEVVVKNDYIVVLFKLLRGLFGVGDTLAGRACDSHLW